MEIFYPSTHPLYGSIRPPGDKSISHRTIMLGAIAKGTTYIDNFLNADDCRKTINIFSELGVKVEHDNTHVRIHGREINTFQTPSQSLYVGNSGTTARLTLGILSGFPKPATVTGDPSLSKRPMDRILTPLKQMGVKANGRGRAETLPVTIQGGTLTGIHYKLPVKSAQVKSAILLAGLFASTPTKVIEPIQTRDHTENMLRAFGADIQRKDKCIHISNKYALKAQSIQVPGDLSSAAFLLGAAAIIPNSSITIKNMGLNPTRSGFIDCLKEMGAKLDIHHVQKTNGELTGHVTLTYRPLRGITIEGEIIPRLIDEIPIIALIATQAKGKTIIRHAEELRIKETDRIEAIAHTLTTLGASILQTNDGFHIDGETTLSGGKVSAFADHRMAMMVVIASKIAKNPVIIDDISSINISYPDFFSDLAYLNQG